ncbi:alpha/beta hydrolase [Bacteroidota bacterium]
MVHNELDFLTGDGLKIYGQSWLPDKDCECITCVIHGLGDHSGRYAQFAKFMNEHNIGVFAMDLRGHGKSEGRKGHTPEYGYLLSDIELLIVEIRKRYLDTPIILFGHSMGGNIVANFVLRHKSKEITGAILSASAFRLTTQPPRLLHQLLRFISKIFPTLSFSEKADPMDLTRDPEIGMAYLNDPLIHEKITAKLYVSFSDAADWAMKNANLLCYPTLIYHGGEDCFTSWEASKEFADNAGENAEFKLWEGLRHEPHNEMERNDVLKFQSEWIHKILK